MFGNLIESTSHKGENARKSWFFLGTFAVYAVVFLAIGVGGIYAYNTHIETQNLELVSLITPVEMSQVQTPMRREVPRPSAGDNRGSNIAVVRTQPVITTMNPLQVPNKVSIASDVPELPRGTNFKIGIPGPNDNILGAPGNSSTGNGGGSQTGGGSNEMDELVRATPPPLPPIKKETVRPPTPKTISLGVVNGKAANLPKPVYSAIARAAHARGTVTIQVLIDESGKVVSAQAISGHPLLLKESVQAAYQARFTPTLLSKQPVKVSGIITYNFVMQ